MPAKIITLSQKDQDLLRVALTRIIKNAETYPEHITCDDAALVERIKNLKERLV
jgi:hypothetical protein